MSIKNRLQSLEQRHGAGDKLYHVAYPVDNGYQVLEAGKDTRQAMTPDKLTQWQGTLSTNETVYILEYPDNE